MVHVDLPAGTYAISASGYIQCAFGTDSCPDSLSAQCSLFAAEAVIQRQDVFDGNAASVADAPVAFTSAARFASAGSASVRCRTRADITWGIGFQIVATQVASVVGL
jgi:hypothetical protein